MNASTPSAVLMAHMISASAICLGFSPWISIMLAFVFGLTFILNLALYPLLLEGRILTKQDYMRPSFVWYFYNNLHLVLLSV
jgi:hypothetical protein